MPKGKTPKSASTGTMLTIGNLSVIRTKQLRSTRARRALASGTADVAELFGAKKICVALYLTRLIHDLPGFLGSDRRTWGGVASVSPRLIWDFVARV